MLNVYELYIVDNRLIPSKSMSGHVLIRSRISKVSEMAETTKGHPSKPDVYAGRSQNPIRMIQIVSNKK